MKMVRGTKIMNRTNMQIIEVRSLSPAEVKNTDDMVKFIVQECEKFHSLTMQNAIKHMTWRAIFLAKNNSVLLSVQISDSLFVAIEKYKKLRTKMLVKAKTNNL